MQFFYPGFLWALLALAIPVVIHLFYFRRFKRVYFTNVRFLKEVKEETSMRSRLRNLLVLAMRMLALAFLVFAFAQPFIPLDEETTKGNKAVSIFVDNSFSMESMGQDISLLDLAKRRAASIVDAHKPEDRFQILTHEFEGRHQRLVGKEDALALIDEIETGPAVRSLSNVVKRQEQALNTGETDNKVAYILSDFQRSITDLKGFSDSMLTLNLIPLTAVQERNVSIDSAWFEAPVQMLNQTNRLIVRVKNHAPEEADNVRLSMRYDGQVKPVGTLSIPPNTTTTDTVNFSLLRTGWHEAELQLTDFPVQFDDTYHLTFNVADRIRVLVINQEQTTNPYLTAAFQGLPNFEVTTQQSQNLNYANFPNFELIVLNDLKSIASGFAFELQQFVKNGGNLLVFPGPELDLGSYQGFLQGFPANTFTGFDPQERQVGQINTEEFIFFDVFENRSANLKLPVTQGNYRFNRSSFSGEEPLLYYRDGSVFLSKYSIDQGFLYLCAAPLDEAYSNLTRSGEIFVPMLYKMAISSGSEERIAYIIGQDESLETTNVLSGSEAVYKLKGEGKEFIPEQRLLGSRAILGVHNQIEQAGFYDLFVDEGEILRKYAFNYDRRESDLSSFNESELRDFVGDGAAVIEATQRADFSDLISERSRGIQLWRWCLWLALFFLALEVLLLRFWKT